MAAQARGARLIVVDPRRAGLAARADLWLRVRPGSDGALALGIAGVMIAEGWFDKDFIRDWTNGPLLVRSDTGCLLTEGDLSPHGSPERYVAWDQGAQRPVLYDPTTVSYDPPGRDLALFGQYQIATTLGLSRVGQRLISMRPSASATPQTLSRRLPGCPETRCGRPHTSSLPPVQCPITSGLASISTPTPPRACRAITLLYALTGSFDAPGGNVLFTKVPTPDLTGQEYLSPAQRAKALGLQARPLGPPQAGSVTSDDLYRAILEGTPYAVRGLVGFGANLLVSHADPGRAYAALRRCSFVSMRISS